MSVFISHSSRDHAAVRSLTQHLQSARETVWLDQSLIGGEAWWDRILHQIRSCTVFLIALSNNCLQSKPCRAEIDYAKSLGLPILPVLIGDVDSYRIDPIFTVQSVDYRNPDVNSGMALIAALRERVAERKDLPDPLPDPPPVPYEYLQRLGVAIDSPEELSPTEQSTILTDLRRALREEDDETVRNDIHRLLQALRRRSEATHAIVADIDELLRRQASASDETAYSHQSQPEKSRPLASTVPSTPRWRQPKTIAIAAAALLVLAIVAVVGHHLAGQTSPGSAANRPSTAPAAPSSPPAAPASAAAANQMSGHYIVNETEPKGYSVTMDWHFTPCGDGCASVTIGGPGPGPMGQARLVNGQWTLDSPPGDVNCPDGSKVPHGSAQSYTWDPNTLAGKDQMTYTLPACGNPAGSQQTNSLQLRQAP
jgi:serine/threonine kinase PknH